MAEKRHLVFWILFPIVFLLLCAIVLFYFDLANGPLWVFVLELVALLVYGVFRILIRKKRLFIRLLPTLSFALVTFALVLLAKPSIERKYAVNFANAKKTQVRTTANGPIQGVYSQDEEVEIFTGIPYAKPPVGELRWKEPQDVENWTEVKDCSYFAPRAMQVNSNPIVSSLVDMYAAKGWYPDYNMNPIQNMSEDCLYLNVWKPNTNETNLPILFYIHGGSLTSGTTAFDDYNGEEIARHGVIFVNVAYRLGVFGFFANEELQTESSHHTTGNYGLLDQIKALKWVNDNASYFNGDKNNITIAGESAGSSCVSALCTSPLAKGLFKNAIGESSSLAIKNPPHTFTTLEKAKESHKKIFDEFKCQNISDLRKVKASELVKSSIAPQQVVLDGYVLEKQPYDVYKEKKNNESALLNGFNVKEADAFVVPRFLTSPTDKNNIDERLAMYFDKDTARKLLDLYSARIEKEAFDVFNEIISVYWFMNPHQEWTKLALANGVKVYRYQFTKENKFHGNYHAGELIYAYGNVKRDRHSYRYDDSDIKLSEKMVSYWANFAKNGDPNGQGLPLWPQYNLSDGKIFELGSTIGLKEDPYSKTYKIINEFMTK